MKFSLDRYRQPLTLLFSVLILVGSGACLGVGFSSATEHGSVTVSGPSIDVDSVSSVSEETPSPVPGEKVNINTASVADLVSLPEIGEKRAQYIVDYRDQNGRFKSIEEIQNVKDIGPKRFEKIKDQIVVE